jgi:hypothetical protein
LNQITVQIAHLQMMMTESRGPLLRIMS